MRRCGAWMRTPCRRYSQNTSTEKIRNIGILAHIDAGKTTTTERMLYYSGSTRSMGEVHHGNTVTDFMEQERQRGITIASAAVTFTWRDHRVNLIDTPGHIDFTSEVEQTLGVLDGAVVILDGSAGVEAQTVTVWRQADKYDLPRIVYVNKMDRRDGDLNLSLASLRSKFDAKAVSLHVPVRKEDNLCGIVDVLTMDVYTWDQSDRGKTYKKEALRTGPLWEEAVLARSALVEELADVDDELAESVIKEESMESVSPDTLKRALRKASLSQQAVPVLCGSSYKNIGVQLLMDAVLHYLPAPNERNNHLLEAFGDTLCARAFKVRHDEQRKAVTFFRLFSGKLKQGQKVYNVQKEVSEQVGKLTVAYADEFKEVPILEAGNVVAATGLKSTFAGDLITSNASAVSAARKALSKRTGVDVEKLLGSSFRAPEPVFFCSIEPPSQSHQAALDNALEELQREDPGLRVRQDIETFQTVLSGMGELHIDIIKNRIVDEYKIDVELGPLQVAYKEAVEGSAKETVSVKQKIGSGTHEVTLTMSVSPRIEGKNTEQLLLDKSQDYAANTAAITQKQLNAIRLGLDSALINGPKMACPVIDAVFTVHWLEVRRGTADTVLSATTTQCVKQLLESAGTSLLEPVMSLEIVVEDERSNAVMSDLSRRRSTIINVGSRGSSKVISCVVPLAELMGYSTTLRTITSGRASFTMEFREYSRMSPVNEAKAIKDITGVDPLYGQFA